MHREMVPLASGNGNRGAEPTSSTQNDVAVTVEDHPKNTEGCAELEIRSLLWMEQVGNEVYLKAYRTWTEKDSLFAKRIDAKRNQSSSMRNEIYQSIGFYSVFQGVLLTTVAQANVLLCRNWWTVFFLSVLVSLVTLSGVISRFKAILALEKTIISEASSRQLCINRAGRVLKMRRSFDFNVDAADGKDKSTKVIETKLPNIMFAILMLLFFSGLVLVSLYLIACHSYPDAPAPAATAT